MRKYLCIYLRVSWKCFTFAATNTTKLTEDNVTSNFSFT